MTAPDLLRAITRAVEIRDRAKAEIDALGIPSPASVGLAFHYCAPEMIALAREAGAHVTVIGRELGGVYDSCSLRVPGDRYETIGIFGATREAAPGEVVHPVRL